VGEAAAAEGVVVVVVVVVVEEEEGEGVGVTGKVEEEDERLRDGVGRRWGVSRGSVEHSNLVVMGLDEDGGLSNTGQVGEGSHDVGPQMFLLHAWEWEQECEWKTKCEQKNQHIKKLLRLYQVALGSHIIGDMKGAAAQMAPIAGQGLVLLMSTMKPSQEAKRWRRWAKKTGGGVSSWALMS
jgi:hypothetical protein